MTGCGDSLDDDIPLWRGSTDFWSDPDPDWDKRHTLNRVCSNCDEPIVDSNRTNLCRGCLNKAKSSVIQEKVWRLVQAAQRKRGRALVHAWWEGTG